MLSKKEFDMVLRNSGIGDSSTAKVLFLGIDDHEGITELDDLDRYLGSTILEEDEIQNDQVTSIIAKLMVQLIGAGDWRKYREQKLFRKDGAEMMTYMFPIGRGRQEDWPGIYEDAFGMSSNGYYDFVLHNNMGRFNEIDQLRLKTELLIFFWSKQDNNKILEGVYSSFWSGK